MSKFVQTCKIQVKFKQGVKFVMYVTSNIYRRQSVDLVGTAGTTGRERQMCSVPGGEPTGVAGDPGYMSRKIRNFRIFLLLYLGCAGAAGSRGPGRHVPAVVVNTEHGKWAPQGPGTARPAPAAGHRARHAPLGPTK